MELGLIPVLEDQVKDTKNQPQTQKMINQHLQQTRQHADMLRSRLERLGEGITTIKPTSTIQSMFGKTNGGDGQDLIFKDRLINFVTESFEVASYKALGAAAKQVGDQETVRIAEQILRDEEQMVHMLDEGMPEVRAETAVGMASDENIRITRAIFDAFNAHDLNKWDQYQANDFRSEVPGATGALNRDQTREYNQRFLSAFPDLHFDLERTIAQGAYVVVDWVGSGTHTGPLVGPKGNTIPATGRKARVSGSTTFEIRNGKLARSWVHWDMTTLLDQLGAMPMPQG